MFDNWIITALCALVTLAILAFVLWQLTRTDMDVGPSVERPMRPKDALRFALDNDIPIKSEKPGVGHNGGPPIAEGG